MRDSLILPYWFVWLLLLVVIVGSENIFLVNSFNQNRVLGTIDQSLSTSRNYKAVDYWKSINLYQPTYIDAHTHLALLYWQDGLIEQSRYHLSEVERLDPNNKFLVDLRKIILF